jgi:hypothetical protein
MEAIILATPAKIPTGKSKSLSGNPLEAITISRVGSLKKVYIGAVALKSV